MAAGMDPTEARTDDLTAGADGLIHCRWFAERNLDLLTRRINAWLQDTGKPLEVFAMSHSVQLIDAKTGDGLCTALVMWRLKKRKLKHRNKKRQPPQSETEDA